MFIFCVVSYFFIFVGLCFILYSVSSLPCLYISFSCQGLATGCVQPCVKQIELVMHRKSVDQCFSSSCHRHEKRQHLNIFLQLLGWFSSTREPDQIFFADVVTVHVCDEPFQSCASSEEICTQIRLHLTIHTCQACPHFKNFKPKTCSYIFHKCSTNVPYRNWNIRFIRNFESQVFQGSLREIYLMPIIVSQMQTRHQLNHEEC